VELVGPVEEVDGVLLQSPELGVHEAAGVLLQSVEFGVHEGGVEHDDCGVEQVCAGAVLQAVWPWCTTACPL
jgi:hypothetical protein